VDVVDATRLTIQQVARRSGFSEPTLRYYEQIGLIGPVERDESSGHRRYSSQMVESIEALACLRSTGVSIEDMRRYRVLASRGDAAEEMRDLFAGHVARVDEEITRLRAQRRYLHAKVDLWQSRVTGDMEGEAAAATAVIDAAGGLR